MELVVIHVKIMAEIWHFKIVSEAEQLLQEFVVLKPLQVML
jgi:hypothetical protein